jgi:hypothetical protein
MNLAFMNAGRVFTDALFEYIKDILIRDWS